eukprot:scaffold2845_cov50-Cylindrotheca_fusiformis.AAC.2
MATMADECVSDQHGEQDFCLWTRLVQNNTKGYEISDVFEMVGCSHLSNQHKEDIQRDFDEAVSRIHEGKNERTKQLRLEDQQDDEATQQQLVMIFGSHARCRWLLVVVRIA